MPAKHILVIYDTHRILTSLQRGLETAGYLVDTTQNAQASIQQGLNAYNLVILDLRLPNSNVPKVCQTLRHEGIQTPIMVLTAKDELDDKLSAFAHGADDYLTSPFAFEELLVRIKALLRRRPTYYNEGSNPILCVANLTLNRNSRDVRRGSKVIALTRKEFDLLAFLMAHPNKALSRTSLLEQVWGLQRDTLTNIVPMYIGYLRKKIDGRSKMKLIRTVRAFGYKISDTKLP